MYKKYEMMLNQLAWGCLRRMPEGFTTFEDLKQEANLIYCKVLRDGFDQENGAAFGTVLYKAVINKFSNLLRDAYRPKHINASFLAGDVLEGMPSDSEDQLEALIGKERKEEILRRLYAIDADIADFVRNGPPPELLRFAKHKALKRSYWNNTKYKEAKLTWRLIESFYGINLRKIIRQLDMNLPTVVRRIREIVVDDKEKVQPIKRIRDVIDPNGV